MILVSPFCGKNLIDNLSSFSCLRLAAKHVIEFSRNGLTCLRQLQRQELLSIVNCLGKNFQLNHLVLDLFPMSPLGEYKVGP